MDPPGHPPIIDAATFQVIKTALTRHKALAKRNRKHEYLFAAAWLRCGRCGRGMTGVSRRPGDSYYRCNSWYNITNRVLRCSGNLRADVVEQRVWAAIMRVLEQPELIAAEVARQEESADEQREEIKRQLVIIEAALAKCDREAQRWADAYAGEVIDLYEFRLTVVHIAATL
jgi:Recombinase zinc beta ribbon domain